MNRLFLIFLVTLLACRTKDGAVVEDTGEAPLTVTDGDGDGFDGIDSGGDDCDDTDDTINPGAAEICDGIDNNCDGQIDEGVTSTFYADADGDGFGDAESTLESCDIASGYVAIGTDCDDDNADSFPGAPESCDELDNNCDGQVDEGVETTWYLDADADGYGNDNVYVEACEATAGYVDVGGDCDDSDALYNPGANETDCADPEDYNCDGSVGYADDDGDGFAACEECDDSDADVNPAADEVCDQIDNNCDGEIDEDSATDAATWYADSDGDGFGDASSTTDACSTPSGYVDDDSDCDDSDVSISPDGEEVCDSADNDCDGDIDEDSATDAATWYEDDDGDGYGDPADDTAACSQPSGYIDNDSDCDDSDATINPDGVEVCDYDDNDCDGSTDEDATDAETFYADADADGFGDADSSTTACDEPSGYVEDDTDCDDSSAAVNPDAGEICDEIDNDCDGSTDEDASDVSTFYADDDGDGFGDSDAATESCDAPSGHVEDATDCDDADSSVNPDAAEVCDGIDNDCDGTADDGATDLSTYYADGDGDGYGDPDDSVEDCGAPSGYVVDDTDCDDGNANSYPGADEICDGEDNDCDGTADDGSGLGDATWYADADGDGYGDPDDSVEDCEAPSGYVADATDCDDDDAGINPGAEEVCDSADNDCDGSTDEDATDGTAFYTDSDGDGFGDPDSETVDCTQPSGTVTDATDCNDSDAAVNPDAEEVCDGVDNDCDGDTDGGATDGSTFYADDDGDGFGDPDSSTTDCSTPTGHVSDDTDCDDTDSAVNPDAEEVCDDETDNNCDGDTDEVCPIEHCGYISSDETWEDNGVGHVVTCTVLVSGTSSPVLTIEDGAEVYFDPGTVMYVGYPSYGELVIDGHTDGVLLTSSEDSPAPGDWYGLYIWSSSNGADITGATIEYGGSSVANIYSYASTVTVTDSTIQYSAQDGIYGYSSDLSVTDTVIADNDANGLYCYTTACLDETVDAFSGNTVSDNGGYPLVIYPTHVATLAEDSTYAGNGDDTVRVLGGYLTRDADWHALDVPYSIGGTVYVYAASDPTLTIEDGAELLFDDDLWFYVGNSNQGNLVVDGHTEGVLFSSINASPSPGDWYGLYLGYYTDADSQIDGLTVEYGGGNSSWAANVFLYYSSGESIAFTDSTFTDSAGVGLYGYYYTEPVIQDSTFADNDTYGVYLNYYAELGDVFSGNTLTGNGSAPMQLLPGDVEDLDTSSTFTGNGEDYIEVYSASSSVGQVQSDATWAAMDVPYHVTANLYVTGSADPTLTLESGVEVYFGDDVGFFVGTGSGGGNLIIDGAAETDVLLSSYSGSGAGDWTGLYLGYYSDDISQLSGFTLENAGAGSYYSGGIYLYGAEPTLSDCLVQDNRSFGIYDYSSSTLTMSDCTITGTTAEGSSDGNGVDLAGSIDGFSSNTLTDNDGYPMVIPADEMVEISDDSTYSGNGEDYVKVDTYYAGTSGTWADLGVPFLIDNSWGYLNAYGNSAIPVEITVDGAEVHFAEDHILYVGWSSYADLYAEGAVFTSAEGSPGAGDWSGVYLGYYTSGSTIEDSEISYAGGSSTYPGNLVCYYCTADVTGTTLSDSLYYGIYATGSYSVSESGNTYSSNGSGDTYPKSL